MWALQDTQRTCLAPGHCPVRKEECDGNWGVWRWGGTAHGAREHTCGAYGLPLALGPAEPVSWREAPSSGLVRRVAWGSPSHAVLSS